MCTRFELMVGDFTRGTMKSKERSQLTAIWPLVEKEVIFFFQRLVRIPLVFTGKKK